MYKAYGKWLLVKTYLSRLEKLFENLNRDVWLWSCDPWPFAVCGKRGTLSLYGLY